tara:strand:+ start:6284 stop:7447 length:1164 start_codon:yes stop_codon:yes gene_type:complete
MATSGWGDGAWGSSFWGGFVDADVSVNSVTATATLNSVTASSVFTIEVAGVSATTSINDVTPQIPVTVSVTGIEGISQFLSGWGSSAWGDHIWGGGVFADIGQTITPASFEAQAQIASPTVIGTCIFSVTGVAGTTTLDDVLAGAGARVVEEGLTGTVSFGDESVVGTALITTTGVSTSALISGYSATTITKTVTVVSTAGGNKYFIDGVQQPTLELFEGNTYRFDQSDSSNSGHPLRLSTTSDGTHGGGSIYSTGVVTFGTPGTSGAYTEITVAVSAPTLYYYCSVHSGMGGQANTPFAYRIATTTGAPVTNVTALTSSLGEETVFAGANIGVTLAGLTISLEDVAISGSSVLSLTGVSGTGSTGEEQVYSLIEPDQLANWLERVA